MRNAEIWSEVDGYVVERLVGADPVLDAALAEADAAGLPPIAVSAAQGKMLHLLATMVGARRILELGTLGGYSTIWLGRALPAGADARLISLELEARHAEVARSNLARAGLADRVEVRVGPALETLPRLAGEGLEFDFVFIDADKANIPAYFDQSVALCRPGAVIVVDNVVRGGALADPASRDPSVQGVRRLHEQLEGRTDVSATTIQTVGAKGYDGFTLALVGG
ncbi:MAG TPA: O-methyltransferase [Acidimicrobiales bacterium]|nr:O-methyltransferase [Acidimicrobiales bacterium]